MDCENCTKVNEEPVAPVEYIVHEGMLARLERANKRVWILCIILTALLLGSWIGFFVYEAQYQDVVITADQSSDSGNNYAVGGDLSGEQAASNH